MSDGQRTMLVLLRGVDAWEGVRTLGSIAAAGVAAMAARQSRFLH